MQRLTALVLLCSVLTACSGGDIGQLEDPGPRTPSAERGGIPVSQGTHVMRLDQPGFRDREYRLRVPRNFDGPLPLVLAVHGGASTAERFQEESGFDAVADDKGFLVAYPEGFLRSWNAGPCCGPAKVAKADDAGFLRTLIDRLVRAGVADPERVFVAGFSNGGGMAYRLACEGPGRVKGIGVVSASLVIGCEPERPVSAMIVHGRKDTSVPFQGGGRRDFDDSRPYAPVSKAVTFFRKAAGIAALTSDKGCRAGKRKGIAVRFCPHGGGHVWPENAARDLWRFFAAL